MDRLILAEKLESLRRCVARVEARRLPSAEDLATDADVQDIVSLNLMRAVQLCVDIALHVLGDTGQRPPATMEKPSTSSPVRVSSRPISRRGCAPRLGFGTSPCTRT